MKLPASVWVKFLNYVWRHSLEQSQFMKEVTIVSGLYQLLRHFYSSVFESHFWREESMCPGSIVCFPDGKCSKQHGFASRRISRLHPECSNHMPPTVHLPFGSPSGIPHSTCTQLILFPISHPHLHCQEMVLPASSRSSGGYHWQLSLYISIESVVTSTSYTPH